MKFIVKKDDILTGLKIVERATIMKGLQPVLANILIETVNNSTIKLSATDFDLSVITEVDAQVENEGAFTLPAKKLSEIVSRVGDNLITFELIEENNTINIKCKNSKFDIIGISSNEFPKMIDISELKEENSINIEIKPFAKAVDMASFAAASYESNNLLSGVVCDIRENILEIASTDGNRLARVRENIENGENNSQLIIPSRTLNEFIKMTNFLEDDNLKIYTQKTNIVLKTGKTTMISRLMEGQYPKYNQLIPENSPKEAIVNIAQFITSLERVSVMVNERTSIVKLELKENVLKLSADTPDAGASQDEMDIDYKEGDLTIAFNYRYLLEALKKMDSENVKIGLNTNLSATIFRPDSEEDYICLIMPVQIR